MEIGLGCMRLSTDPDRDEERALATLRAAREAGVRLFDTAAAYGRNAREHHGERLLARAFGAGLGELEVVTKAGMARPKGGWRPDGRRKTILADAEASRRALGVEA
ncbi:MAG TPA: aldo/keto reductase, partial [Polyangiaceae bacterium LLY-WYZ-15_(1-7)]|nr:aldo/keto reductase [Polyangiaceae bacterium LLY-WYZ-15_(1-7)]